MAAETCAHLLVLADGMGGHAGGALAAQAVVDVARERFRESSKSDPKELLADIVRGSHERINAIGMRRGISPHSTCVVLHLTEAHATWSHVGDSRLYRFRRGLLVGRTMDHSVVELMRLQGRITEEQMKTHPDQNRLFEALGGEKAPAPDLDCAAASDFDGFLLASDGLWEHTSNRELARVVRAPNLETAVQKLVKRARRRGGKTCDNISVAVARRRATGMTLRQRLRGLLPRLRSRRPPP